MVGGRGWRVVASLMLTLVAFVAVTAQAQGALYIGSVGIDRSNLDGSVFQSEFVDTENGGICAIAVDAEHIYWSDFYESTIGRANLDGTDVENDFISLPEGQYPCGLAVDSNFIYWANRATDTIARARLDGSDLDRFFIRTEPYPCGVAVDEASVYWSSETEHDIWRTDIAGLGGPELVIDEAEGDPCGIALEGNHLYWANGAGGAIGRANLDGSEALPKLITGLRYPVSLAIEAGHLYWVNAPADDRSVGRSNLDGSDVVKDFIPGRDFFALAADSVVVPPPPPPFVPEPSRLKLGKLRRQPNGIAYLSARLAAGGFLQAEARGLKIRPLPDGQAGGSTVEAGRKWLRLVPNDKDPASKCVVRALRRGDKVRVSLRVLFHAPPMLPTIKKRKFFLFKPGLVRPRGGAAKVSCSP